MKLTNFAFLPPLDDIKKELLNRLKNDFPEIQFIINGIIPILKNL